VLGVINTMLRVFIIILGLVSTDVFSIEKYEWFSCPHDGSKYISDVHLIMISENNGFVFAEKFYDGLDDLEVICKFENKGKIRITTFKEAPLKLIESYSRELKRCGWNVLPYEEIDEDYIF